MKTPLNFISPLPPKKSGIANYALKVAAELSSDHDITFVVEQNEWDLRGNPFEVVQFEDFLRSNALKGNLSVLHMGNNRDHVHVYRAADHVNGLCVQHDLILHHFIEELTLAQGDFEGYADILENEYGHAGRSIALARRQGIFDDTLKFLLPASNHFVRKSRAVLVHSQWAARRLRPVMPGVVFCVPHFVEQEFLDADPGQIAQSSQAQDLYNRLGIPESRFTVGLLGFATEPKCVREIVRATLAARASHPDLHLVIGGQMNLPRIEKDLEPLYETGHVSSTGYLSDEELKLVAARLDLLFCLRFPVAGESSGILSMGMGMGTPCATFDFGPMSEYPQEAVFRIPFEGRGEPLVEAARAAIERAASQPAGVLKEMGERAKDYARANLTLKVVGQGYREVIASLL